MVILATDFPFVIDHSLYLVGYSFYKETDSRILVNCVWYWFSLLIPWAYKTIFIATDICLKVNKTIYGAFVLIS